MNNLRLSFLMGCLLLCLGSTTMYGQKKDPVRSKLKWDRLAAPSNADGEIEKIYFGYTRPDGKHFNLTADLMFPVAADQFTGGDIEEPDINFDGIPDLIISLGAQNGYGTVVYDGFVWNAKTKKFDWVDSFREIGNPEINASEENIIGYDRQEQGTEVSEWMWGGTDLVMIDRHFEVADTDYETIETRQMRERALVGYWEWVDDGEKPSTIHLTLDLQHEAMTLYVNECTIYGSTAAFDLECDYENGILTLKDTPERARGTGSLQAQLRLNERGDLTGNYECRVGEKKTKGTVTLRKKDE